MLRVWGGWSEGEDAAFGGKNARRRGVPRLVTPGDMGDPGVSTSEMGGLSIAKSGCTPGDRAPERAVGSMPTLPGPSLFKISSTSGSPRAREPLSATTQTSTSHAQRNTPSIPDGARVRDEKGAGSPCARASRRTDLWRASLDSRSDHFDQPTFFFKFFGGKCRGNAERRKGAQSSERVSRELRGTNGFAPELTCVTKRFSRCREHTHTHTHTHTLPNF